MATVALENVRKEYPGQVLAVADLSLQVADGEFVVLVGPSGCGKTTTLRMIAGLEEPTAGTILIGDRVVNRVHPKDRNIAMVFQDYALYPHMTVRKNLAFALKLRKVSKAEIERRVSDTANLLGIMALLDRKPRALSGGQRQRVAVGRAIVRNPQCYLFDEPLSNLDAKLRTQMRAELKALHLRLKTTTVYVTHDQEEAMTLGDRLVVMSDGLVHQVGSPLEVYQRPVNRFVAGFLGSPPMNFIEGRIERADGRLLFTDGSGIRLRLSRGLSEAADAFVDRPVVLGIRPEQLRLNRAGATGDPESAVTVEVSVTEPLGDRMDIYAVTSAGAKVIARVDATAECRPGAPASFRVDPVALHLFEPGETGGHLLHGRATVTA
ncbi:MAG: sn-glycerol-3-phosphate ABC transporter ATP-binding protein UgpC [Phycisphaerales bacterium]|nr:MAG: sn-glycerol-3-phosphate ABC transporter ATP-binding protein UgpC [Phycisphaerales bacterium]